MNSKSCPFCNPRRVYIAENVLAYAIEDMYPVSPGHTIVVTRRHILSYFDTTAEEKRALQELVGIVRDQLQTLRAPDGYNIGINDGVSAGQTVMHVHVHVIPRYTGDTENPRGGVRGVIPAKQNYKANDF